MISNGEMHEQSKGKLADFKQRLLRPGAAALTKCHSASCQQQHRQDRPHSGLVSLGAGNHRPSLRGSGVALQMSSAVPHLRLLRKSGWPHGLCLHSIAANATIREPDLQRFKEQALLVRSSCLFSPRTLDALQQQICSP